MSTPADESPKRRFGFRRKPNAKPGRIAQLKQVYDLTREVDPAITWWMLGAVLGIIVVGIAIGIAIGHPLYVGILAIMLALMAGMLVLSRRADAAMYKRLDGQPGAAGASMRLLRGSWVAEEEPVAVDPRTYDSVFRALGRAGVVLVGDGPPHRIGKLLTAEEKKHRRYISNTPITLIQAGDGEGQVPLRKLSRHIMRLKPTLTKEEVSKVAARLRSMPGLRAPIPKGVDPTKTRPDRKANKGR